MVEGPHVLFHGNVGAPSRNHVRSDVSFYLPAQRGEPERHALQGIVSRRPAAHVVDLLSDRMDLSDRFLRGLHDGPGGEYLDPRAVSRHCSSWEANARRARMELLAREAGRNWTAQDQPNRGGHLANTVTYRFSHWFVHNWARAGLLVAILLLLIAPLVYRSNSRLVLAVYLWLPFYMLHQYEEHGQGTFLDFYRRMMPRVAPMLTERKLLLVNVGTVWALFLMSVYAAMYGVLWLALYPVYLSLVNALMHVGQLVARRSYNPGLWTALVLFFPAAAFTIRTLNAAGATRTDNVVALGFGLLAHFFFFALGRGWIAERL